MIIKTIVPNIGEPMYYIGKPVTNGVGTSIGSISEVKVDGDHLELTMDVQGVYSKPDRDIIILNNDARSFKVNVPPVFILNFVKSGFIFSLPVMQS